MKRCLIYLADPIHNYISSRDNWMIPLNALSISSYTKSIFGDKVDIRVFKFPDLVMDAIEKEPPDIIGVSNYIWNSELSKLILRFAKEQRSKTVTVMGGPNIVQTVPAMTSFLRTVACDYYVSGAGEHPFMCLVRTLLESGSETVLHEHEYVHGVWYLNKEKNAAVLKPVVHTIESLDEIPSPFESGMVDEFFDQGLTPMVETNRGCPFSCVYCVWGSHKVYKYSVERVKADIDYCRLHSGDELIMLNDANFGLFVDRDVEIAEFIRRLKDKYSWPSTVIVNWGQVKSEDALRIAGILRDVCILRQSSQSLNPAVLNNIKRKNMTDEQWRKVISFCDEQGIDSFGELILMLPGETMESYLDGLRYLFGLGVDCINTNQLQLLNGAEINTPEERHKYSMETRWRLLENCYGRYKGRVAIEAEEIVVQTNTFSYDESMMCRPLNWLIQMSWTLRRHDLLLRLIDAFGTSPVDFLLKTVMDRGNAVGPVRELFDSFMRDAEEELFSTRESLVDAYSTKKQMSLLQSGSFRKLNTHYSGRERECGEEFVKYYIELALDILDNQNGLPVDYNDQIMECARFVSQRNIGFDELKRIEAGEDVEKVERFQYDILAWSNSRAKEALSQYLVQGGISYRFSTDERQCRDISRHMRNFSGISREYQLRKLHEPYYGIRKENLLFRVTNV